jgi:hypothetical protein
MIIGLCNARGSHEEKKMRVLWLLAVPMLAGCGVREANLARNEANSRMYTNQTVPSAAQKSAIVE